MDLATIIGMGTAFGLILISMGSGMAAFVDGPSAMIVFGGTLGAAMIHYRFPQLKNAIGIAKKAFSYKGRSATELINTLVEHASQARREGILALEAAAQQTDDPFLKRALQLAVDGHEVAAIESILSTEIEALRERHKEGAEIFSALGGYAPALGMIGTLVGLVLMLQQMDDPSKIGPAMAVALITTFYGAVLANLVFNPIAGKLKARSAEEILQKELTMEGVLSISQGDNPRLVEQKLSSFLKPALREAVGSKVASSSRYQRVGNHGKKEKGGSGGGGGGGADDSFAMMFTSLNLILLSFFILLNALSVKDSERERRAIGSLRGTFGILEGGENPWAEGKYLMRSDLIQTRREKGRRKSKLADRMALILRRLGMYDGNATAVAVRTADGLHLRFSDRVLFLSGRIEINPKLFPALDQIAKVITRAGQKVVVRGFTDASSTPAYPSNLELSASRAVQVARYLVEAARVPAKLVMAEGRGVKQARGVKRLVEIFVPESSLRAPLTAGGNP